MKRPEKKAAIVLLVSILMSITMMMVLPAIDGFDDPGQSNIDTKGVRMEGSLDSSGVSLDFSIGREISINL